MYQTNGSFSFSALFDWLNYERNRNSYFLNLIPLFFLLGVAGKSAQLRLHSWLPDAMEGPTPVSALIHAATMVTAGVYLLIRLFPLLERLSESKKWIILLGGLTALIASASGCYNSDIKKVIA